MTGRRDLLAAIPYLLGYQPVDNDVVLVAARRRQILLIGRGELDWPDGAAADSFGTALTRLTDSTLAVDQTVLIGYGPADITANLREVAAAMTAAGYPQAELIHVADGRYRYRDGDDWVPPDGVPVEPSTTAAAAHLTALGLVALDSRADRIAVLAHDRGTATAMRRAIEFAAVDLPTGPEAAAEVDDLLATAQTGRPLTDEQAARLILLMHHGSWRDCAWLRTDGQRWLLDLWCDLSRRSPPPLVAPVASLAAWCAWRAGDSVLAQAGVDRALDTEPGYQLAMLIAGALEAHLPPTAVPWPPPADVACTDTHPASDGQDTPDPVEPTDSGTP